MKGIDNIITHAIIICMVLDIVLVLAAINVTSDYSLFRTTDTATSNVATKDINYERRSR